MINDIMTISKSIWSLSKEGEWIWRHLPGVHSLILCESHGFRFAGRWDGVTEEDLDLYMLGRVRVWAVVSWGSKKAPQCATWRFFFGQNQPRRGWMIGRGKPSSNVWPTPFCCAELKQEADGCTFGHLDMDTHVMTAAFAPKSRLRP